MSQNKIKVLYIAGWGRSGSTILARILGQIDGFFHGGELRTIWVDGLKPKSLCGCGVLVKKCPIWNAVFDQAFGGINAINPSEINELKHHSEPRTQEVLSSIFIAHQRKNIQLRLEKYHQVLTQLYQAIHSVTNSRVIIDDSLHPGYAYTLALMPNIDLYIVHLIRDARGSAYSWSKNPKIGLGSYSLSESALGWNLRNITTETLAKSIQKNRYLQIFYEDFVNQPQTTIQKLIQWVDESPTSLPFVSENEVKLGMTHSVFGNPDRIQTGITKLKLKDDWKTKLKFTEKGLVTTLTFPLLLRYGYFSFKQSSIYTGS